MAGSGFRRLGVPAGKRPDLVVKGFTPKAERDAIARSPEEELRAIIPGASALIKALCDELEMAQVIDAAVEAFYTGQDVAVLFGPGVQAGELNEGYPEKPLHITHGHSNRPVLKQIVFGILAQAQGLPVAASVHDGNQSDKVWNGWVLEQYERLLAGHHRESLLYVVTVLTGASQRQAETFPPKTRTGP